MARVVKICVDLEMTILAIIAVVLQVNEFALLVGRVTTALSVSNPDLSIIVRPFFRRLTFNPLFLFAAHCLPGCDEQHGHCNRPNECT